MSLLQSLRKYLTETKSHDVVDTAQFSSLLSKFEAKHIFGNIIGKNLESTYIDLRSPPPPTWADKFLRKNYFFSKIFSIPREQLVEEQFQNNVEYRKEPDIRHFPLTLLPDLVIEEMINNINGFQSVPVNLRYNAVLLVIDVSGFTPLTEMYNQNEISGTDELAADLNTFMGNLASGIMAFGGDILSFAGDAYLCQWDAGVAEDINEMCKKALKCAVYLQTMPRETDISQVLRVKIGIALGETTTMILGSPSEYLSFIIGGDVLINVQIAESYCGPGEIVVSKDVFAYLKAQDSQDSQSSILLYETTYLPQGFVKFSSISRDIEVSDPCLISNRLKLFKQCGNRQLAIARAFIMPMLRDMKTKDHLKYLSEVSQMTILFILLPTIDVNDATTLDHAFQVILRCVQKYEGALNKVLLFDKGCTFLAVFGLPGLKHLNDASRAVSCADLIISDLEKLQNLEATTGISSGTCFCGMMGHPQRQEYTVIGWRVNMACRLMTTYGDEPVVLDADTYHLCCNELGEGSFVELEKRKLKGIQNVPAIYAYRKSRLERLSTRSSESSKGPMTAVFKTHDSLKKLLLDLKHISVVSELRQNMKLPVITIRGPPGSGRSFMLYHSVEIANELEYQILAFCATETYIQEPFSSIFFILRYFIKLCMLKEPSRFQIMKKFIRTDDDPFLFVLNHLFNIKYRVPRAFFDLSIEIIYQETGRLLKLFFKQFDSVNGPILIAIDDAHHVDPYSWQLLHSLCDSENFILLLTLPLDYLPSCSASAIICGKTFHEMKLDGFGDELVAPLICWFLGVDAVHESIVGIFKDKCEGNSQMLEELLLTSSFASFIRIVPKTSIPPDEFESLFISAKKALENTEADAKIKVCDIARNLPKAVDYFNSPEGVTRYINNLGIHIRIVLKRAAVLGLSFSRHTLDVINFPMSRAELDSAIAMLVEQNAFILVCDTGCHENPNLATKKHPSVIGMVTEYGKISSKLGHSQVLPERGPMKHSQQIQFVSSAFRNNVLMHMTRDQRTGMHVEVAKILEERGLTCINCTTAIDEFLHDSLEDNPTAPESERIRGIRGIREPFKIRIRENLGFVPPLLLTLFLTQRSRYLQLVPLDLRKCDCLEQRTKTYELISFVYKSAGMLLLPIKYLVKAAETCILSKNLTQAFSYIDYCFKTFPKVHKLASYEFSTDEVDFVPDVLKASLYRLKAQILFDLNNMYSAASNAMKAISILRLDVLCLLGTYNSKQLDDILKTYAVAELKEISHCLSILCLTYGCTSEFQIAYELAVDKTHIVRELNSGFIEKLHSQCLYYKCKIKVSQPGSNFESLEEDILNICHERLVSGKFPIDLLEIREIAKAYIAIMTYNLNQGLLERAAKICQEAYRIMKCVHETEFTPRILSLAIETCIHNREMKLLVVYLNNLRTMAIEDEVQMASFCCGTIRYTCIQGELAAALQLDRLGQCKDFIDEIRIEYIPQDVCYFIAANLALWFLESRPVVNQKRDVDTFMRWYQLALKQKFKSYDSYWHVSAELTMTRIDLILQFRVRDISVEVKQEQYSRILDELKVMKVGIDVRYPVLERVWWDLIEVLRNIWPNIYPNKSKIFHFGFEACAHPMFN